MKKQKILLLLICLFFSGACLGQNRIKKDTVYYLLDTIMTSPGDKLLSITCTNGANTSLEINCPCRMDGGKPRFSYNVLKPIPLSVEKIRTINYLTLRGLIDLARHNDDLTFLYNYVLYFIKPSKDGYVMYAANIPRTKEFKVEDWITVPPLGKRASN
ncbi:MAG: hypothetical protein JWQ34_1065 [Mucilaginibacter sp.]|uniref:hypothetical protein n=1 Tax=Mucilaginibacter sp. TaxID=1882438 RepID=UPI0026278C07|nr:hypothetical protein [Mucilaginibacter sp.]MDB5002840.1 hypothetical protein [Mucilaginibacter sp.]